MKKLRIVEYILIGNILQFTVDDMYKEILQYNYDLLALEKNEC